MIATPSLADRLQKMRAQLRAGQQQLAAWQAGSLAVSAVPGAGKSTDRKSVV